MEKLREEKIRMGTDVYEQEFMGNPIPDGKRMFRQEWFQEIDAEAVPKAVNRFVTVDPAIGQKQNNDDTAIVISSMDCDRNIYVEEVIAQHIIPNEIIQTLFGIYERKKVMVTGIEMVGFQKTLQYQMADESRRRHKYPLIEELKSDGTRKEFRIRALQPYFENRKVYFVKGNQGIEKLKRQLLSFPTGRFDDCADAFSYLLQIMRPGAKPKAPAPHPDSFQAAFDRICERRERPDVWGNQSVGEPTWQ